MLVALVPLSAVARDSGRGGAHVASSSHPSYTLPNARAKCKAHYKKETVKLHEVKHHKKVTVTEWRCVYVGSSSGGGGSTTGSGGSGGSGGGGGGAPSGPVAVGDSYAVSAGGTLSVPAPGVLANDQGTGLSADLLTGASHGTVTLNHNGGFTYTPSHGFSGVDHFTYKDTDSSFNSSVAATVTITVAPAAANDSYVAFSGGPLNVPAPGVLGNDLGSGLSAHLVSGVAHGSLTLNADGSFVYTSNYGYTGSDSFTYKDVDDASNSSNVATVTLTVTADVAPAVVPETFSGAIGNTELQAGGTPGSGPERYQGSASGLAGDSDPNGGTLSTTAATITTAQGGSVSMGSDGTFIYTPPTGFAGPSDSFTYQVDTSEGTDAQASATIDFSGERVWYVNDALASNGDGTSSSPFNTLAALGGGTTTAGDVIFLYGSDTPYAGGVTLLANQTLAGESAGLVVGGATLLAAAGTNPTLTNASGAGVTLADGDTVEGVSIEGTSGDGISASGVDSFTLASSVSVTNSGEDGLDVSGGSGTIDAAASISGSTEHSVAIEGRGGGTATLSGTISDDGAGVLLADNGGATVDFTGQITAVTGAAPAFTATGGGTVSATGSGSTLFTTSATALDVENTSIGPGNLTFQSISVESTSTGPTDGVLIENAGTSGGLEVTGTGAPGSGGTIEGTTGAGPTDGAVSVSSAALLSLNDVEVTASAGGGVFAADVGTLDVTNSSISGSGENGVLYTGNGSSAAVFDIEGNTLTGETGTAIEVELVGNKVGWVTGNQIGDAAPGSGSASGNGIGISNGGSANTLTLEVYNNVIESIAQGYGMSAQASGSGTLNMTVEGNTVTMGGSNSLDGMTFVAGGASTMCLESSANASTEAGSAANGMSLWEDGAGSVFALDGYVGGATDTTAVETFLDADNPLLTGSGGGADSLATIEGGNTNGFETASSCPRSS
jgi:hypothetical protein